MKHPAYPRTKPSGVEWLGDVPVHWETKKVTYGFSRIGSGTTPKSDSGDFYDGEVPWVTTSELRETLITKTKESVTRSALSAYSALRLYPAGTLLFAMYGATIGRLGTLGIPATLNQACCAFAAPTLFDIRFVFYWLWMRRPILISLSTGGGQPNLSQEDLRQIRIPTPPLPEQRVIAHFLDRETGRVDLLVAKKRELIERLKEKRTALISRTVTHGLPPAAARAAGHPLNPPLKLSGVEWLGEVPKHWEVMKVKYIAKMESGHTPSRSEPSNWVDDECVIPWVSLNDTKHLKEHDYIGDTAVRISEEGMKNSSAHLLPPGVVVFTRDATIGLTAITTCPAAVSQHVIAWVPGPKITPKYLLLCFKVMQQYLESFTFGSTLKTIGMTDVRKIVTPVPPLSEQAAIASYLDHETAKLDALVGKVEAAVERLQEYRSALITAAVTGKIDVRKVLHGK